MANNEKILQLLKTKGQQTSQQLEQRGFASIGPAHNGKAQRAFFIYSLSLIHVSRW